MKGKCWRCGKDEYIPNSNCCEECFDEFGEDGIRDAVLAEMAAQDEAMNQMQEDEMAKAERIEELH